jgi:Arc/MetJ-type ribon-helix-helix transcriptional regulator
MGKKIDIDKALKFFTPNSNDYRGKLFLAGHFGKNKNEIEEFLNDAENSDEVGQFIRDVMLYHTSIANNSSKLGEVQAAFLEIISRKGYINSMVQFFLKTRNDPDLKITYNVGGEEVSAVSEENIKKAFETAKRDRKRENRLKIDPDDKAQETYNLFLNLNRTDPETVEAETKLFVKDRAITFSYNLSKFYLKQLLNSSNTYSGITEEEVLSAIEDEENIANTGDRYEWRNGKLFDKRNNINVDEDAIKKRDDKNCFDFGLAGNKGGDRANLCLNLIRDCIHGENVDECKKLLIDDDFWGFDKDEFKKMNIKLAKKMLDQFQFKSSAGVYESVDDWIKRIREWKQKYNLKEGDIQKVQNNNNLVEFLKRVVEELNSNTIVSNNPSVQNVKKNKLGKWGLQLKAKEKFTAPSIVAIRNLILRNRAKVRSFFVNPFLRMAPIMGMYGGGEASMSDYVMLTDSLKRNFKNSFELLSNIRSNLTDTITSHNHKIDSTESKAIDEVFKKLQRNTMSFLKYLTIQEKYAALHAHFNEHDSNNLINVEGMKAFISKSNNKFDQLEKSETQAIEILEALQDAVGKISSL